MSCDDATKLSHRLSLLVITLLSLGGWALTVGIVWGIVKSAQLLILP